MPERFFGTTSAMGTQMTRIGRIKADERPVWQKGFPAVAINSERWNLNPHNPHNPRSHETPKRRFHFFRWRGQHVGVCWFRRRPTDGGHEAGVVRKRGDLIIIRAKQYELASVGNSKLAFLTCFVAFDFNNSITADFSTPMALFCPGSKIQITNAVSVLVK